MKNISLRGKNGTTCDDPSQNVAVPSNHRAVLLNNDITWISRVPLLLYCRSPTLLTLAANAKTTEHHNFGKYLPSDSTTINNQNNGWSFFPAFLFG